MKKTLFTVTGPSASGKSSLFIAAMGEEHLITSFTTRAMRKGEKDGVDYHFITKEQFDEKAKNGELFESETHYGNHYGITQEEFENKIKNDCFFVTNAGGLRQIKEKYDKVVSYFIMSPYESVEKQMRDRGGDEADIQLRLTQYKKDVEEMMDGMEYDVVFHNVYGKFEEMVDTLKIQIQNHKEK